MGTLPECPLGNQHPASQPLQLLQVTRVLLHPRPLDGGVGAGTLPLLSDTLCSATLEADLLPFPSPLLFSLMFVSTVPLGLETLLHVPG